MSETHKPNRMVAAAHKRDVPKHLRPGYNLLTYRDIVPPMRDPIKTLGHPARPRKKR